MKLIPILLLLALTFVPHGIMAQTNDIGIIEGRVYNAKNNEPIPFANIVIWGTNIGSTSDLDGNYIFTGVKPGFIELRVSSIGFKPYVVDEFLVTNAKKAFVDIPMEETSVELNEVVVRASPFRRIEESPLSLRRIGISEIEKNPGGNRDISRVLQSFPGVASSVGFRNDLIVRGGGPNENSFYLDGVEIPNLNHFATQGASGGPVGIINVDFIREIDFYSGAFPANRGNSLSSILDMKQVDGNKESLKFRGTVGASDLALTLDGPLAPNTTFILSARRSYLQLLFNIIGLPFLPTYNDYQFKSKTRFNEKNELTIISLGSYDVSVLNLEANETEEQRYILSYLPENQQWSYAIGAVWKHFRKRSYDTFVLSRNYLDNRAYKFQNNNEVDSLKTLDYESAEIENKFRYENTLRTESGYKINLGFGLEYSKYLNNTFNRTFINDAPFTREYESLLDMFQWGLFGQVTKDYLDERLTLSLGFRADANSYSKEMSNLLDQLSPRFSASFAVSEKLYLNYNMGRFYQMPPYTTLGYRNLTGDLLNKQNGISYIKAGHIVGGFEYRPGEQSKITLEGFYKRYQDYPFSVLDSVPISSKAADFGTFGDEEILPISEGQAYGFEFLYRNRDLLGFNVVASYTFYRSEFDEFDGNLAKTGNSIPSAWDNRHLLNVTATRSFKRNWDFGFKWRFVGGAPYTPFDELKSSYVQAWNAQGLPYLDYRRFNQNRLRAFHQLDVRVDKSYFFDRWSLIFYVDIQNLYNFTSDQPDRLSNENENGDVIIINPGDPIEDQRYLLRRITGDGQGTVLPTLGIIVEF
jgi:hypothetical protein